MCGKIASPTFPTGTLEPNAVHKSTPATLLILYATGNKTVVCRNTSVLSFPPNTKTSWPESAERQSHCNVYFFRHGIRTYPSPNAALLQSFQAQSVRALGSRKPVRVAVWGTNHNKSGIVTRKREACRGRHAMRGGRFQRRCTPRCHPQIRC